MGLTDLEHAALSGELFQPRSNSPTRSDSTSSPLNTDDELASDLDEDDDHKHKDGFVSQRRSGAVKGERGESTTALIEPQEGPRTGIKGVINDQKAHTAYTESETKDKAQELRKRMERTAITTKAPLSTKTISGAGPGAGGDEKENGDLDVDGREGWRKRRIMEMESTRKGLKELGKTGFVHAVEKAGWVLVLIYEPEIQRCQDLLNSMLDLSTKLSSPSTSLSTPITLYRARATTLAFSLLPSSSSSTSASRHTRHNNRHGDRDEDDDDDEAEAEAEADPDVLPTLLAYKDGEIERKWIRVDWDIGQGDLEGLLRSEGILPETGLDDRQRY